MSAGLWKHTTCDITFCLVVDDFGIKYTDIDNTNHILNALKNHYKVSIDWKGEKYLGMQLNWDYDMQTYDISMPGYIDHALA